METKQRQVLFQLFDAGGEAAQTCFTSPDGNPIDLGVIGWGGQSAWVTANFVVFSGSPEVLSQVEVRHTYSPDMPVQTARQAYVMHLQPPPDERPSGSFMHEIAWYHDEQHYRFPDGASLIVTPL